MPTIAAAVQDSGVIDVTLEEGEEGDSDPAETQGDSSNDAQSKTEEEDMPPEGEQHNGNPAELQDDNRIAVQGSGTIDVTFEGERVDGNSKEVQSDQRADTQTKTIPNNRTALPGSGSLVDAMGGVQQGDDYPTMLKKAKYDPKTCHQGTQTELFTNFLHTCI